MAQFASKEAIANTPRSPRFNNSIPQNPEKVNRNSEKTDKSFALPEGLSHITNGMSDAERYEILKNKNITISSKTDSEK